MCSSDLHDNYSEAREEARVANLHARQRLFERVRDMKQILDNPPAHLSPSQEDIVSKSVEDAKSLHHLVTSNEMIFSVTQDVREFGLQPGEPIFDSLLSIHFHWSPCASPVQHRRQVDERMLVKMRWAHQPELLQWEGLISSVIASMEGKTSGPNSTEAATPEESKLVPNKQVTNDAKEAKIFVGDHAAHTCQCDFWPGDLKKYQDFEHGDSVQIGMLHPEHNAEHPIRTAMVFDFKTGAVRYVFGSGSPQIKTFEWDNNRKQAIMDAVQNLRDQLKARGAKRVGIAMRIKWECANGVHRLWINEVLVAEMVLAPGHYWADGNQMVPFVYFPKRKDPAWDWKTEFGAFSVSEICLF